MRDVVGGAAVGVACAPATQVLAISKRRIAGPEGGAYGNRNLLKFSKDAIRVSTCIENFGRAGGGGSGWCDVRRNK